jgi:hypothetical protein
MSDPSLRRTERRQTLETTGVGAQVCGVSKQETSLLPNTLEAPGHARVFIHDVLCPAHGHDALVAVQLVSSEMVTEAVLHGQLPLELAVTCHVSEIRVTVSDRSTVDTAPRDATDILRQQLISKVTRNTGVEITSRGRAQWCTVPTGHIPRPRSPLADTP